MLTDYDCFAYETMFWQCSAERQYEVLFQSNFANNSTYSWGICVS